MCVYVCVCVCVYIYILVYINNIKLFCLNEYIYIYICVCVCLNIFLMLQSCCSTVCHLSETCIRNKMTKQLVRSGNAVEFARRSFLFPAETLDLAIVVFSGFCQSL